MDAAQGEVTQLLPEQVQAAPPQFCVQPPPAQLMVVAAPALLF
jgi:hypothetical protein